MHEVSSLKAGQPININMCDMADRGPILVKSAPEEDGEDLQGVRVDIISQRHQKTLSVQVPEDVLRKVSENTEELQEKLNRFVNGLDSKIQSVYSPGNEP
jgi:hypothetical protein